MKVDKWNSNELR